MSKAIIIIFCGILTSAVCSQKNQNMKLIKITGTVWFVNQYTGGIKPSEEVLEQFKTKYIFANSTFVLKSNSNDSVSYTLVTDDKGAFNIEVVPDTYSFFMTPNFDKSKQAQFDETCAKWLSARFGELEVTKNKLTGYELVYNFGRNPCEPKKN